MGLAAFNRMRREQAEREAKEAAEAKNEPLNVDEMTTDELKSMLDKLGVKFGPNTGEAKLREKLKGAL